MGVQKDFPIRRGGHYYIDFDGQKLVLPSVTTIINDTLPKKALMTWAAKVAAKAALDNPTLSVEQAVNSIYQKRDAAGNIGQTIHSWAEAYGNGSLLDPLTLPENIRPYGQAFHKFMEDHSPKIIHTECTVFSVKHGYAGQLDLLATLKNGKVSVLDYKTGKGVYWDHYVQQAAYAGAEYIYTKDKKVIPMPKVDEQYLVHLKDSGLYSLIGVNEPFESFLKVMEVWKLLKAQE